MNPINMLTVLLLISFLGTLKSTSNSSMIITWGQPTRLNATYINESLTWEECVNACSLSSRCVLAYHNTTACHNYHYISVPPVTKTKAEDGFMVAFKVLTNGTCPIGDNAPTFGNKTAQGYMLADPGFTGWPEKVNYTFSFVKNQWVFAYKYTPACTLGFVFLMAASENRPQMCVAYYGPTAASIASPITYTASSQSCVKELGGTLATINSVNDYGWYTYVINYFKGNQVTTNYYTRIDGVRKAACRTKPATEDCASANGFTFTDTYFTGTFDYYNWTTSSSARNGTDDDCLVFVINGNEMKTDVKSCTTLSTYQSNSHICTKAAFS